jgi:hypothetical protein
VLAFADDLGGTVAGLNIAEGFRTTPIESKSNIFHACPPGRLTGIAVPIHVGRRTIVVQTSIYRSDGKLAAMMTQTQLVLPWESAAAGCQQTLRRSHSPRRPPAVLYVIIGFAFIFADVQFLALKRRCRW